MSKLEYSFILLTMAAIFLAPTLEKKMARGLALTYFVMAVANNIFGDSI